MSHRNPSNFLYLGVGALACLVFCSASGCGPHAPPAAKPPGQTQGLVQPSSDVKQTVSLEFDFGDGKKQQFDAIAWRDGMTVIDLLIAARDSAGGPGFEQRGEGANAFVEGIGKVRNGGPGATDKNWVFRINGQLAHTSAGDTKLRPADHVLWRYEVWE